MAVVADVDLQLVGRVADVDVRVARVRVLERVGQALLDDPVGGEVERARQRDGLAVDVQPHRQAGAAEPRRAAASRLSRPGWGASSSVLAVAAHRAEQAAHLGERRAAGPLDAPQRLLVLAERVGQLVADGADLEHHHADGVGDDVVQLARDPRALLGDRDARRGLALALGVRRALLRRLGLRGALAQREAGEPGDREQRPGVKTKSPAAWSGSL